jgi:hypothetical protein
LQQKYKQQNLYPKVQFIQRFFLYRGLTKYYEQHEENDLTQAAKKISNQPMEKFERDLMKIFVCDPAWPICLYDFTYKNKCPTYYCFRVERNLSDYIIPDYFFEASGKPGKA